MRYRQNLRREVQYRVARPARWNPETGKFETEPEPAPRYLEEIEEALETSQDGLTEAQLRGIAPVWYLNLLKPTAMFERKKERRPDAAGRMRLQWVWRIRPNRPDSGIFNRDGSRRDQ